MKKGFLRRGAAMGLSMALLAGGVPAAMGEANVDAFAQKLHGMYDKIEVEYRPDVRWWLPMGLNTDETLKKNIQEIYDSGFGAAEFLALPEPGADTSLYGWGSEEWTADSQLIIKEAVERSMGFSLTSGTHWANANLPDTYVYDGEPYTPDNKAASQELDYSTMYLKSGEKFAGELPYSVIIASDEDDAWGTSAKYTKQVFQGVVAAKLIQPRKDAGQDFGFAEGSETGILDLQSIVNLTDKVVEKEGTYLLDWTAPEDGDYALFTYWMHGTSQTATPSVNTNYTVNYMDSYGIDAMIKYWEEVVLTDELKALIQESGRGEIYMDSLELSTFGAGRLFWGFHLKEEFLNRKGYDVTPYLPFLTVNTSSTKDYMAEGEENLAIIQKVQNDLYSVMNDMYSENVLKPLQEWLHGLNMKLRAEPSYGVKGFEISTPAQYVDGIETESYAQNADVDLYRGMLGSANMYNRLFSSETGAVWGHNYFFDMDEWTQLCYLQFAEGINRTVFHGYSGIEGSEEATYWPGHEGMYASYSERFNSRQPASEHYKDWTEMLARNQKALRQGTAARDIAILRTDYDYFHYSFAEEYDNFTKNYTLNDKQYFFQDLSLQNAGYTYDYFSPMLLLDEDNVEWNSEALQPNGAAYKALMVYTETIELECAKKLLEIAKDGLPVIFLNNSKETNIAHYVEDTVHGQAASRSMSMSETDEEIQAVVAEIKALKNVVEVDGTANVLPALQELGVYPRVSYADPENTILNISRNDRENNIFYTFVYSFKFNDEEAKPGTYKLAIEGEGVPYSINDWTGDITKLAGYEVKDGRTSFEISLEPGESTIIALDRSAGVTESEAKAEIVEKEAIVLPKWDITIEDWNEGEKIINLEEKFGHETREVYYSTKKTELKFEDSELMAWKDLPATEEQLASLGYEGASMNHVSGIGSYATKFDLPADWNEDMGAYLSIESANGGSVAVYVNGQKAKGMNIRTLKLDISDLLVAGENEIVIEVASTLTNRMIEKEYKYRGGEGWTASGWDDVFPGVQDYGMVGEVKIVPYTVNPNT